MQKNQEFDWIIEGNPKDKNLKPEFCLPNTLNKFIDLSGKVIVPDSLEESIFRIR